MATNLDVVLADPDASVEELRRTAQIVRRTVDRTTRTVEELAMYARRDVPQTLRERVDLDQVADEVVEEYRGPIDEHRLSVERIGEPVAVDADRTAVKRALGNLLNNAVRLTPDGATVRVGSGRHGDFAWVGVDDHGPGIDPRDHAAVFQRDSSGDRSSLREERRTGLGLAIARQIAQAHGGLLTLRSVRGAGASFVMWLPLAPGADRDELSDDGVHALHDPFVDPD
jgi:signal transduction histidine kinase